MKNEQISFGGIVQGEEEIDAVMRIVRSDWHTSGNECQKLENELAAYTGAKYCAVVNSGSSANLLALASLELKPGDKVLTSACGFPATLNPILHLGLTPVLVDYDLHSYNININQIEDELSRDRNIKAIIFAHTLGNPVDMIKIMALCDMYNVKIIEDCCEALGSTFNNHHVGTFGQVGTLSFYPSHQINGLGMGGAIITNDEKLLLKIKSMRSWGKIIKDTKYSGDHISRYNRDVGGIMYDDQFTYATRGWNMQLPDVNAAYARVQLTRLPYFVKTRINNYNRLNSIINSIGLVDMKIDELSNPSYFGYPLTIDGKRDKLSDHLLENGIKSRPFFAGNITRHIAYHDLFKEYETADYLMRNSMFVGVWHGLNDTHIDRIGNAILDFFNANA